MDSLISKHCVPCEGGTAPLTLEQVSMYRDSVPTWQIDPKQISRDFTFADFKSALEFVNKVGALAESEGHHPDVSIHNYNHVLITLSTHAIGGLSENDFVMAVKINELLK